MVREEIKESLNEYRKQEMENHNTLVRYNEYKRSNTVDISNIIPLMDRKQQKFMYAINHFSRIELMENLMDLIANSVDLENESIRMVTFTPDRYLYSFGEANKFEPSSFKKMIANFMRGQNYLGMIEPAYYPLANHARTRSKGIVHWHAHLVSWGSTDRQSEKTRLAVCSKHQSFIKTCPAFKSQIVSGDDVSTIMAYATKSPRNSYGLYVPENVRVGEITGKIINTLKQRKKRLRPGEAARLALAMKDMYLDKLLLGGDKGAAITKVVIERLLKSYHANPR